MATKSNKQENYNRQMDNGNQTMTSSYGLWPGDQINQEKNPTGM